MKNKSLSKTRIIIKKKINIIPLIDIIFLLLIFFMLATNFNENKQIDINLSNTTKVRSDLDQSLNVFLTNNNQLSFDNKLFKINDKNFESNLMAKWNEKKYKEIFIICEEKVNLQILINYMDRIKSLGIDNVFFGSKN